MRGMINKTRPPAASVRESVEKELICAVADKDFARARALVSWFEDYEADEAASAAGRN